MTASRRRKPKTYVEVLQRTVDEVNAKIKDINENPEKYGLEKKNGVRNDKHQ